MSLNRRKSALLGLVGHTASKGRSRLELEVRVSRCGGSSGTPMGRCEGRWAGIKVGKAEERFLLTVHLGFGAGLPALLFIHQGSWASVGVEEISVAMPCTGDRPADLGRA